MHGKSQIIARVNAKIDRGTSSRTEKFCFDFRTPVLLLIHLNCVFKKAVKDVFKDKLNAISHNPV